MLRETSCYKLPYKTNDKAMYVITTHLNKLIQKIYFFFLFKINIPAPYPNKTAEEKNCTAAKNTNIKKSQVTKKLNKNINITF